MRKLRFLWNRLVLNLCPPMVVKEKSLARPKIVDETQISPKNAGISVIASRRRRRSGEALHHLTTGSGSRLGWTTRTSARREPVREKDLNS